MAGRPPWRQETIWTSLLKGIFGFGVGLGLYFCRLVVEAHGGAIKVSSEVGRGTAVAFAIPQISAPGASPDESTEDILERLPRMGVEGERVRGSLGIEKEQTRETPMWISLFTIASAAAICLSVAAIVMQPMAGRPYNG